MNGPAAARSAVAAPEISPVDRWISRAAAATVVGLAGIAGAISYSHMRDLAQEHGQSGWHAHAFPLSVDGVQIVASLVLLADRRAGRRSGWLPWAALVIGTSGSLAANVATAGPGTISRLTGTSKRAIWPGWSREERGRGSGTHLTRGIVRGSQSGQTVPGRTGSIVEGVWQNFRTARASGT
jgi:Protein of unknown function (DUF2637)